MAFSDDLTTTYVPANALRPGLRLKPLESRRAELSETEIDDVIARTLAAERQAEARAALPAIASQEEITGTAGRRSRHAARERSAAEVRMARLDIEYGEKESRRTAQPSGAPVEDLRPKFGWVASRLGRWPRRILLGTTVIAAAWIWPWLLLTVLGTGLLLTLAGIFALGSDAVSGALIRLYHWRHSRDPERAERMRIRLDALAMRMDSLLDWLPEGWTTGLYMADFSREALDPQGMYEAHDPFDRLREEAARG
ncbi:hypothetical protein SAMN05421666_1455 [Roseovarius nanhaiticus]|uniref:Uncharacterized protein n=1 Tax=Roseovarius nanhaiticus TaxID=573024 RepID=A0A1N7FX63_9RHOB|nr:hypothetical protein [Roseovarius nanhaiticus]SEK42993.1 hypothetical protein SAMN05216208_0681 [Roseovarius nanhaiticus]SIS04922.1 hypothetical protein SAMN05421666_1455 [Roseovarius nanhaiticus]